MWCICISIPCIIYFLMYCACMLYCVCVTCKGHNHMCMSVIVYDYAMCTAHVVSPMS